MTLTFEKLTFPLNNSKEQLGNLSEVAVSTLLINPHGPFWLFCCAKLTLDLIDDIDYTMILPVINVGGRAV